MKKLFSLFLSICFAQIAWCQMQASNWCFRDSCGIHFTATSAIPFISAISFDSTVNTAGGNKFSSSISDAAGNLLFYTNGFSVWNRNPQKMPNMFAQFLCDENDDGVLILPQPGNADRYLIFHLAQCDTATTIHQDFNYKIVDMTLDSGLGDVMPTEADHVVDTTLQNHSGLAAVRHANGRDWWVVRRTGYNLNDILLRVYLVTPDTVLLTSALPVVLCAFGSANQISFSSSGDKMAICGDCGDINLLEFDRCTGTLSNLINLSLPGAINGLPGFTDNSFSADGSKLYVCSAAHLYQFDLNAADIVLSRQTIWVNPYADDTAYFFNHPWMFSMEGAPDEKIYINVARGFYDFINFFPDSLNENLCVINDPNLAGALCNFVPFSFNLGGHWCDELLPNEVNYDLGALEGSPCDTLGVGINEIATLQNNFTISPNPVTNTITIRFQNSSSQLTIQNLLGEVMMMQTISSEEKTIDVSSLPSGIYLLEVKTDDGMAVKKFVKE